MTGRTGRGRVSLDAPATEARVQLVLLAGVAATNLTNTVLGASLETIRTDLGSTLTNVSWVLVAPALIFAVTAPLFGKLSDNLGGRRVYIAGLFLSLVGAVLTALAWDTLSLIAFRIVGMMGAAATGPAAFTLMAVRLQGRARARAIGLYSAISAASPMVGLGVGGPLIELIGWRALFVAQAVPCAAGFLLALALLPDTPGAPARRFDLAGGLLLGGGVSTLLFALNRIRSWGIGHGAVLACLAAGPFLLGAFVAVERRRPHPLLPLHYLRRRRFSASISTLLLGNLAYSGGFVVTPVLLERRYGYGVAATAYIVTLRPLLYAAGSWVSQSWRYRWGIRRVQVVAAWAQAGGALLLLAASSWRSLAAALAGIALTGGGGGLAQTTLITTITDAVDPADSGIASATASMVSSVGSAVGTTMQATIVAEATDAGPFVAGFAVAVVVSVMSAATAALLDPRDRRVRPPGSSPGP